MCTFERIYTLHTILSCSLPPEIAKNKQVGKFQNVLPHPFSKSSGFLGLSFFRENPCVPPITHTHTHTHNHTHTQSHMHTYTAAISIIFCIMFCQHKKFSRVSGTHKCTVLYTTVQCTVFALKIQKRAPTVFGNPCYASVRKICGGRRGWGRRGVSGQSSKRGIIARPVRNTVLSWEPCR